MRTFEAIQDFLGQKRIAIVGVSRQPKDFSHAVLREFKSRGYDIVAVNPASGDVEGQPCFRSVREIQPPVAGALLMTPPAATEAVVRDCAEAGIGRVWMFRGGGKGAVSPAAIEFCRERGIAVIPGECPLMFLPGSGLIHRFHGWVRKIGRSYPQ